MTQAPRAPAKIAEVITLIDARLQRQSERGSPYLVGDALTEAATTLLGNNEHVRFGHATGDYAGDSAKQGNAEILCR